jgi:hypothetical protein
MGFLKVKMQHLRLHFQIGNLNGLMKIKLWLRAVFKTSEAGQILANQSNTAPLNFTNSPMFSVKPCETW